MALLAGGQVGQITLENKSNCNGLEMLDVITFFLHNYSNFNKNASTLLYGWGDQGISGNN